MSSPEKEKSRPMTARGYKGPQWLIDNLPRFGSSDASDGADE